MSRFKIILFFFLLAAVVTFLAHPLRSFLTLTRETALQQIPAQAQLQRADPPSHTDSLSDKLAQHTQTLTKEVSRFIADLKMPKAFAFSRDTDSVGKEKRTAPLSQPTPEADSFLMQITNEELRPSVHNPHFDPEISVLLDNFLSKRRLYHTELAKETEDIFGEDAKQEVIVVLTEDEQACLENAKTSSSREEFAIRQKEIDQQTEQSLYEVFLRHRQDINRKAAAMSPAWKAFFKRLRDYQRVVDGEVSQH